MIRKMVIYDDNDDDHGNDNDDDTSIPTISVILMIFITSPPALTL